MKTSRALSGISGIASLSALLASSAFLPIHDARAQDQAQPAATEGGGLEEIIVTARKRSEDIQSTPISITALSAPQLAALNVETFQDLRGLVPDLIVAPQQGSSGGFGGINFTIRGLGQGSTQINTDNDVGLYVDDMYVAVTEGNQFAFFDLDGIQVLDGPQGTLFGKNTIGGAVLLTTKRPTNDNSGYLSIETGNYNRFNVEGAINVPITDNLLTRFSFREESEDGYEPHILDSGTDGTTNDKTGRLQIRMTPSDSLTFDVEGEYASSNTVPLTSTIIGCDNLSTYPKQYNQAHPGTLYCSLYPALPHYEVYGGALFQLTTATQPGGAEYSQAALVPRLYPHDTEKVGDVIARINWEIDDNLSLKSITGFRRTNADVYSPTEDVPSDIYSEWDTTTTEELSQEIDLNGTYFDGRLTWQAGLYYETQNEEFAQRTGPDWDDPIGYNYLYSTYNVSKAAFIQATYKVTDQMNLTLGGRYGYDSKAPGSNLWGASTGGAPIYQPNGSIVLTTPSPCTSFVYAFATGGGACGYYLPGPGPAPIQHGYHDWYDFAPRAQLDYHWTPDIYTYVAFNAGYQEGGFNQQLSTLNVPGFGMYVYGPEKVNDYEGGVKTEWLDHRVRFNATGFYQNFTGYQSGVTITLGTVVTRQTQASANVHEDGVEATLEVLPTPDLILRANFAFLDQGYDSIYPGSTLSLSTAVSTAPRYTTAISGDYTFHLPSEATLVADLNWRWIGSAVSGVAPTQTTSPTLGLFGGRLTYQTADRAWTVSLWSTNLLNKYSCGTGGSNSNCSPTVPVTSNGGEGYTSVTPAAPRQIGLQIRRNF